MQMQNHLEDQFKMISCHSMIRAPSYELITIWVYKLIRIIIHDSGVSEFFSPLCLFPVYHLSMRNLSRYGKNMLVLFTRDLTLFSKEK